MKLPCLSLEAGIQQGRAYRDKPGCQACITLLGWPGRAANNSSHPACW